MVFDNKQRDVTMSYLVNVPGINTTNEREGSLPHHRAMNETNLKTINCMIKNFPTNKVEKIQDFNSRTIFFFNSVSFAFKRCMENLGISQGV